MKRTTENTAGHPAGEGRIFWMDAARTAALFGIVGCHVFAYQQNAGIGVWKAGAHLCFASQVLFLYLARFGVPFFLMLTGALLLKKEYRSQGDIVRFYKHSWFPLFLATQLWIIILHVWCYAADPALSLWSLGSFKLLVRDMFRWEDSMYVHMWYMRAILGVYLFIPFLSAAVKKLDMRVLKWPGAYLLYCVVLMPLLNLLYRILFGDTFYTCPDFITFTVYILLGYFIVEKQIFRKLHAAVLWLMIAVLFAIQFAVILYESFYMDVLNQLVSYTNIFIFIGSILAFELASRGKKSAGPAAQGFFGFISRHSFGCYVIHFPVMVEVVKRLSFLGDINYEVLRFTVTILITSAISIGITCILGLIPFCRRCLVHIK